MASGGGMPPLNLQASSHADGRVQAAFDNSGWVVHVGKNDGSSWGVVLIVAALAWWLARRASRS